MSGVQVDALPHTCGTSKGLKVFAQEDGKLTGFCFACHTYIADPYGDQRSIEALPKRKEKTESEIQAEIAEVDTYPTVSVVTRKLRDDVLRAFSAKTSLSEADGVTPTAIYWPVTKAGKRTGYHVKVLDKSCPPFNVGDTRGADLLNWENARSSGAYRIFITEGPEDMASIHRIFQMHGDPKYGLPAVCSLPHGSASAKKVLTRHAEDLRRLFKEVVLCFDDDAAGHAAVEAAMLVIPFAKSVKLPTKDANQALQEGLAKAAYNALAFRAEVPKNTSIVTASDIHLKAKEPAKFGELSWPWERMNRDLRGIRLGETVYLGAGTKMGWLY